ncbi:unnamed protein product [Camellia sinensis]
MVSLSVDTRVLLGLSSSLSSELFCDPGESIMVLIESDSGGEKSLIHVVFPKLMYSKASTTCVDINQPRNEVYMFDKMFLRNGALQSVQWCYRVSSLIFHMRASPRSISCLSSSACTKRRTRYKIPQRSTLRGLKNNLELLTDLSSITHDALNSLATSTATTFGEGQGGRTVKRRKGGDSK